MLGLNIFPTIIISSTFSFCNVFKIFEKEVIEISKKLNFLYNKGSAKSFRHINKILNFLFIKFFPISRGNCPSPEIIAILAINIFTNSSFVI